MAFAQASVVPSVVPYQLPVPMTEASVAASALETASWPKTCDQPLPSKTVVTTSQATCVNDNRPGQKIQTESSCAIVSPQREIAVPERFGSAARKLHFDTPLSADIRMDGLPAAPTDGWQQVAEYTTEMVEHMLSLETEHLPFPDYMAIQPNINGRMRAILIDWIVDVTVKYDLRCSTLFLAVSLIDRYLSRVEVIRDRLQLVGTAAVMIAAKFEELNPPVAKDFCYVAADIYTVKELFEMESSMLNHVNFNVACPTASFFLDYFCWVNGCDPPHREMVEYLAELALLDMQVLSYRPSQLAAAAVLLGNKLMGWSDVWPYQIAARSRYEEMALEDCAAWLLGLLEAAPTKQLQAVRKKFSSEKRFEIAV
jgi:hypothetical protein